MNLVRFGARGRKRAGLVDRSDQLPDLADGLADITAETMPGRPVSALRSIAAKGLLVADRHTQLGWCIGRVGKLVCVGLNYIDHAREGGASVPLNSVLFIEQELSLE